MRALAAAIVLLFGRVSAEAPVPSDKPLLRAQRARAAVLAGAGTALLMPPLVIGGAAVADGLSTLAQPAELALFQWLNLAVAVRPVELTLLKAHSAAMYVECGTASALLAAKFVTLRSSSRYPFRNHRVKLGCSQSYLSALNAGGCGRSSALLPRGRSTRL